MGLIRKMISGSAAVATGGLSLGVVQYRSDTERGTRQTRLLRDDLRRQHAEAMALELEHMESLEIARATAAQAQAHLLAAAAQPTPTIAPKPIASLVAAAPVAAPPTIVSRLEDLARLAALRDNGVLSDAEFDHEKASILRTLS